MTYVSEQLSETFSLNVCEIDMEILTLQNDIQVKAQQGSLRFCVLVDTAALKVASLFC